MFSRTRRTKFFAKSSLLRLVADDAVSTGRRILSTGLALQISKWNRKKAFSLLASLPGVFGRKEADLWNLGIFADFLTRKCRGYPDGKKEISVTYGLAFFVWSHRSPLSYSRLGIQTRAARGFAIPSSCGGLGAFGAWPPVAAITDQVARFARHFLSAEQPKMNALKLSIQQMWQRLTETIFDCQASWRFEDWRAQKFFRNCTYWSLQYLSMQTNHCIVKLLPSEGQLLFALPLRLVYV